MSALSLLFALTVAVCWGGNFAASKFALLHLPPILTVLIRFAALSLVLLPFAPKPPRSLHSLAVLALLVNVLHLCLVFAAMWLGLEISTTVIAMQLGVPFSVILGAMFLGEKPGVRRIFGMVIAFAGLLLVVGSPSVEGNWFAFLLALAGAMAWAGNNVYMKTFGDIKIIPLLAWTSLLSLPMLIVLTLLIESPTIEMIQAAPLSAWLGITYSAIFSTLLGYGLWYILLRQYSLSLVAPFSLLTPFVGIASAQWLFDESLSPQLLTGGLVTIVGVGIILIALPRVALWSKLG